MYLAVQQICCRHLSNYSAKKLLLSIKMKRELLKTKLLLMLSHQESAKRKASQQGIMIKTIIKNEE